MKLLRVSEVAEMLNLSPSKVYELKDSGDLAHYKVGGAVRFSQEQIDEYLESCRHGGRQEFWPEKSSPRQVQLKHIKL